jgi:hypothetical protein
MWTSRWITEYSEYKFPHLNIHNLSTRSHTSEEENRSKNCKFKRAFEQGWIRVAWWYRHTFLYFTRCAINMIITGEGSSRLKIIGLLWIYINCDAIDLIPSTQNFITDIAFSYVNGDSSFKPQCMCQKFSMSEIALQIKRRGFEQLRPVTIITLQYYVYQLVLLCVVIHCMFVFLIFTVENSILGLPIVVEFEVSRFIYITMTFGS